MVPQTRPDLHAAIELRFQDNTTGDITPQELRDGLHELVDSALLATDPLPVPPVVPLVTAQLLGLDPATGELLVLLSPGAPASQLSYVLADYAAGTTPPPPPPSSGGYVASGYVASGYVS